MHLLVGEEELEVLELAARVADLVGSTVETLTAFVVATGLVVLQHADAVLHSVDLVRDTAVISVLVSQIVESLTQLGNELVLLA